MTKAQDLQLRVIEMASFEGMNGPRIVADLRANLDLWRSAMMLGNYPLICLRDLPQNHMNLSTLYVLAEPGMAARLEKLAVKWWPSDWDWVPVRETCDDMGMGCLPEEYPPSEPALLRLYWT